MTAWPRSGWAPALPVGSQRARIRRLSRRRMGPPAARRPGDLRAALPRGVPVRAVLADDSPQAREFPRRVRRVRHRRGGQLRRRGRSATARGRRHHQEPGQDHCRDRERPRRPRPAGRPERTGLEVRGQVRGRAGQAPRTTADIPAQTPASKALSAELRRNGFTFIGPVTAYATMQACGIVNDHLADCFRRTILP